MCVCNNIEQQPNKNKKKQNINSARVHDVDAENENDGL